MKTTVWRKMIAASRSAPFKVCCRAVTSMSVKTSMFGIFFLGTSVVWSLIIFYLQLWNNIVKKVEFKIRQKIHRPTYYTQTRESKAFWKEIDTALMMNISKCRKVQLRRNNYDKRKSYDSAHNFFYLTYIQHFHAA